MVKAAQLVHKYRVERDAASEWIEAFDPAIHGHTEAAEHYEWSQLCSEIGIVIASIALLFGSRKVWGVSLVLGAAAVGILGWTHQSTHAEIEHAEHRIEETGKRYKALRKAQDEKANDEELVRNVSAMYGVTLPAAEPAPAPAGGEHGGHEHHKE